MDMRKDHSTFTTMGGYAVIAVVVGLWFYTSQKKEQNRRSHVIKQPTKHGDRDVAADVKKKAEKATKPRPKPTPSPAERSEPTVSSSSYNQEEVEIADKKADRDFARQLSNTHAGTKFNTKKSEDKRQKSPPPSSTTGDADDDLSPQASPVVTAADSQGVSDMLEPVASGPSVLRLTGTDSVKKPKERKTKTPEPVETKKQRQNRKKAEAAKAAREEDEKERKVKMEQQRRAARIAEGRPAKDGSNFVPAQNAWDSEPANGGASVQLLDTFEQQPKPQPAKAHTAAPAATKATSDPWSGLPSEEEQLEMIRQEDSWSEVKTKKKGKKKDTPAEASATPVQPPNGNTAVATVASSKPTNGVKKPIITSSSSSFAALTPEEAGDDDEEPEQEWDGPLLTLAVRQIRLFSMFRLTIALYTIPRHHALHRVSDAPATLQIGIGLMDPGARFLDASKEGSASHSPICIIV
ncbi:hypothetical protein NUW58_g4558 [Xylaria curta]|uniref:Uncharacterized protein n=1 Tax=Xylaria curta TaxID=42375 RepID=A0ACC1P7D9_9PEZI|nr:hypothetical protein NUW58_g4558 [Xylaria curta]